MGNFVYRIRFVIRAVITMLIAPIAAAIPIDPALADCTWSDGGRTLNGMVQVHASYGCDQTPEHDVAVGISPPRDSDWDAICVRTAIAVDLDPIGFCDLPAGAVRPEPTPELVERAFRRLPLPAAKLVIQPPNGRTLVNFETNFYTEQGEFTRMVRLLGRQVELRIWPASFGWRFGDGESEETTSPGAAYPDLEVTHEYLEKGRVSPSVDTTYAAQFRVGGGPWRDVAGTVTIPGSPQQLRVVEARPVLVGG